MDFIRICELHVRCKVGTTAEERSFPQKLLLNFEIGIDSRKAAKSGNVADSVCYRTVCELVVDFLDHREWQLLETLAEDISQLIFEQFSTAITCRLDIQKFALRDTAWVGLSVYRERHSAS